MTVTVHGAFVAMRHTPTVDCVQNIRQCLLTALQAKNLNAEPN